ncbi:MAG: phosphodiester glycosidase family protein [Deltaproteobacteria bacterium]|nr:phosphodiester glycosidase family protein [Deltaproteobacteria bacterium]
MLDPDDRGRRAITAGRIPLRGGARGERSRAIGAVAALLVLAWTVAPSASRAQEVTTTPYAGIVHLHRRIPNQEVHVVRIELGRPEVSVVATRPDAGRTRTSAFARAAGAVVAINANWFGHNPCGLAVGEGQIWPGFQRHCDASLGFGGGRAEAFDSQRIWRGPPPRPWMTEVITGKPWLVKQGRSQHPWRIPTRMGARAPRTAAGLTRDDRTLILLVADGRAPHVSGLTGQELAAMMIELGAWNAINLDGGGSSTLFIDAEGGVVNRNRGFRERIVGNHLGIRFRGRQPGPRTAEETRALQRDERQRRRDERASPAP